MACPLYWVENLSGTTPVTVTVVCSPPGATLSVTAQPLTSVALGHGGTGPGSVVGVAVSLDGSVGAEGGSDTVAWFPSVPTKFAGACGSRGMFSQVLADGTTIAMTMGDAHMTVAALPPPTSTTGYIAGIVVLVVVAVGLLGGLTYFILKTDKASHGFSYNNYNPRIHRGLG